MLKKLLKDKLNAKYQGVLKKLTPKGLDLLVDKLSTKVTTEDELEDFVNGLENVIEPFVDTIQSETDRRIKEEVDKAKAKAKGGDGGSGEEEKPKGGEQNNKEEIPAWAKGLQETVTSLQTQLATEKSKNARQTFIDAAKAKGIPQKIASMYPISDGTDNETALTELEASWAEIKQAEINNSLGDGNIKKGFQHQNGSVKEATEEELNEVFNSVKI